MMMVIPQREYIQNFIDFVSSFAISENITVAELNLVKGNLEILRERIQMLEDNTMIMQVKPPSNG